jgi:hypothetical protein
MGPHAYSVTNALSSLAATAFTWSNAATTNRSYLNDGRMDRRMVVGSSVASGINVVIDMGSATSLMGFVVLNSNAATQKTDAALRIRGADDAGITSNVVTAKSSSTLYSTTSPRNKDHALQFAAVSRRYWELTWTWTGNVTNFAVGEIWAFTSSVQLSRRSIYGSGEGRKVYSSIERFQTGEQRGLKLGGPQRMLSLQFSELTASERDELFLLWSTANGNVTPLIWIDSYEAVSTAAGTDEQNCIFGRLEEDELMFENPDYGLHRMSGFTLRSAGREAGG